MRELLVDVHSHPLLPRLKQALSKATGRPLDKLSLHGVPVPPWSVESHLEMMEKGGITSSLFSLPGMGGALTGQAAAGAARALNEDMAEIVGRHPQRLGAFAVVPLDDMDLALQETVYALDELKMDGVGVGTHYAESYLGDERYNPWFAELDRRGVVLFVHPIVPPGLTLRPGMLNVGLLEFMFDTCRMVTNMVLSGTKARFPNIKVISTHAGGAIPQIASRLTLLEPLLGAGEGRPTQSAEEMKATLATFYFDLTASTGAAPMDAIRHLVPAENLLLGFDYPIMPADLVAPALSQFREYTGFTSAQKKQIASGNALRLFPRLAAAQT